MKLVLKKINLKEETKRDIESKIYDIDKFINYIKEHLKKANYLIENKILDLDEQELYDALKEVFDIKYDNEDYLEILSKQNEKHYTDIITINTNMIDNEGYNISYLGAKDKKLPNYNERVPLSEIRNITESSDFVVLKELKYKLNTKLKSPEKYENHKYINFDQDLDENNELFDKVLELIIKEIKQKNVLKKILSDLQSYINELMYQAKEITKLSESDNPELKQIGLLYKKAFEENFNKKQLTQKNNHKRRY